jgi:hemerythrin
MALLTWNSKYSVGIQTIDKQHSGLFDSLNELHGAMMSGKGQIMTGPVLQKLVKYTREHFSAEESMMTVTKYPQLAEHQSKHRAFTQKVTDFVARFERKEASLNLELMNFLRDWLIAHIQGDDAKYGPWLKKNGVR